MYVKEKSTLPNYLYDIEGVENEADYNVEKTNRRFYFSYFTNPKICSKLS